MQGTRWGSPYTELLLENIKRVLGMALDQTSSNLLVCTTLFWK
jgi:hypothetical protein